MAQIFVDDSVHDQAGFVIGACIYTEIDIVEAINNIIISNGFDPKVFEFKSSTNYSKEPAKAKVRSDLKGLLRHCKLGIVIVPREYRNQLGFECIKAIKQFIELNNLTKEPIDIYFDQGMFKSLEKAIVLVNEMHFKQCNFIFEQNSLLVPGIQMADLAAHISSIQLKDQMGLVKKMVPIPSYEGYEAHETELGFEMWATLRYTFFKQHSKKYNDDESRIERAMLDVEPYGLYVSELCDEGLAGVARSRFSRIYMGCIH